MFANIYKVPYIRNVDLAIVDIKMTKQEHINWLKNELQEADEGFRRTILFEVLREELTRLGYWKNKARGNPRAGFSRSDVAQKMVEFNIMLKERGRQ